MSIISNMRDIVNALEALSAIDDALANLRSSFSSLTRKEIEMRIDDISRMAFNSASLVREEETYPDMSGS